jgi:fructose-1,6-bisphosphatase I/sedoheptulose-1,7-bisphosphatase
MLAGGKSTLTQFLIESRRRHPKATGDLNGLVTAVALACKAISRRVALGALADTPMAGASIPPFVDTTLDQISNRMFMRATEWGGHLAGVISEQTAVPYPLPVEYPRGKYLLVIHPLDGASNADINVTVGSIFAIYRAPNPGADAAPADFQQPGTAQVCAGYAIYGPATMLVLTFGAGTHGFTLDPQLGEWMLSHPDLRIPASSSEFAINAAMSRYWEPAVKRYVDECLEGRNGPRKADFNLRWVASLVAETHRILMRGGICMYPRDTKDPDVPGRKRLLYEASPLSLVVEQAGGQASTGRGRVLDLVPTTLHQRCGFVFGSSEEVARVESYHREGTIETYRSPLFAERGLFASED